MHPSKISYFALAVLITTFSARATDAKFINPPASNVVVSSDSFPVYETGSTITVKWTAGSSYEPLNIVLRTLVDGILQLASGLMGISYVRIYISFPLMYKTL